MSAPTFDCRTCGACCVSPQDTPYGWADVTHDDAAKMSRRVRLKLVTTPGGRRLGEECYQATPVDWCDDTQCAPCSFLRGTPGKRVSCSIYETRPRVCQEFKPGSRRCLKARSEQAARLAYLAEEPV